MTRYAEDLKLIANVIGGSEIQKLNLNEKVLFYWQCEYSIIYIFSQFQVDLSSIKLYYMYEFEKETHMPPVQEDIKEAITKCAYHLKDNCNSRLIKYNYEDLCESAEMCVAQMLRIDLGDCPNLLEDTKNPKVRLIPNI